MNTADLIYDWNQNFPPGLKPPGPILLNDESLRDSLQSPLYATLIKAYHKNDVVLAYTVYSGVPSHVFGLDQIIDIGPMSGKSNVLFWLERHGIPATDEVVDRIFARAKQSDHTLTEAEILECLPTSVNRE